MAAPKGNQYAKGCETSGRPPKYDLLVEAKDLNEWSKTPDADSLYSFTYNKDYLVSELWEFAKRSDEFADALKKAKERIAINREIKCNNQTMNYGVWARSAAMYSKSLYDFEEMKEDLKQKRVLEKIDYEYSKKKEVDVSVSQEIKEQFDTLMSQISSKQSKRKKDSNNTISDH
jgi:hypothetical protein